VPNSEQLTQRPITVSGMSTELEEPRVLRETHAPRTSRQRFAFDLLRVEFAPRVGRGGEVTGIDSRRIGVKVALSTCWVSTL